MAHTTLMKDSEIGDDWIRSACAANPVQRLENGLILSGPVRIAFADGLFDAKPRDKKNPNSEMIHSCTLLFPPPSIVNLQPFWDEYFRIAAANFAQFYNPQMNQYVGIEPCFREQSEKFQLGGYTTGNQYFNTNSRFKPPVVDARMNAIVNKSQFPSGTWAIVALSAYATGTTQPKKGPRFGVSNVMKIADDKSLEGSAPDSRVAFASVKVQPPTGPVGQQFGQMPPTGMPPVGAGVGQVYGAPPAGYPQPGVGVPYAPTPQQPPRDDDLSAFM